MQHWDLVAGVGFVALLLWDTARRFFASEGLYAKELSEYIQKLGTQVSALNEQMQLRNKLLDECVVTLESLTEKNRAIMKGFVDSMTDLVKLSEEDKQVLLNRLAASKFDKKRTQL